MRRLIVSAVLGAAAIGLAQPPGDAPAWPSVGTAMANAEAVPGEERPAEAASEPRIAPRPNPRTWPRIEPRTEPTAPSEPRVEPRTMPTAPFEPRVEPRTEPTGPSEPRIEPRSELTAPSEPQTELRIEPVAPSEPRAETPAHLETEAQAAAPPAAVAAADQVSPDGAAPASRRMLAGSAASRAVGDRLAIGASAGTAAHPPAGRVAREVGWGLWVAYVTFVGSVSVLIFKGIGALMRRFTSRG